MSENLPHSCHNCGASMTGVGRLESLLADCGGDYLSYGQLRERLVGVEIQAGMKQAEIERLRDELKKRESEDAAMDIDIERILVDLPPITPGSASVALSRMRYRLGMETGPIGDVVIRGVEEIERLREELQTVTKSRDHYLGEFNRFDRGYWDRVRELNDANKEIDRLIGLLEETAASGVELNDERLRYVVVQIPRDLWDDLAEFRFRQEVSDE